MFGSNTLPPTRLCCLFLLATDLILHSVKQTSSLKFPPSLCIYLVAPHVLHLNGNLFIDKPRWPLSSPPRMSSHSLQLAVLPCSPLTPEVVELGRKHILSCPYICLTRTHQHFAIRTLEMKILLLLLHVLKKCLKIKFYKKFLRLQRKFFRFQQK